MMKLTNTGGTAMEEGVLKTEEVVSEEKEKRKVKHLQIPMSPEEFKEVSVYVAQNDIGVKGEWLKTLILREVRGIESVQTNERLRSSETIDGFDVFR